MNRFLMQAKSLRNLNKYLIENVFDRCSTYLLNHLRLCLYHRILRDYIFFFNHSYWWFLSRVVYHLRSTLGLQKVLAFTCFEFELLVTRCGYYDFDAFCLQILEPMGLRISYSLMVSLLPKSWRRVLWTMIDSWASLMFLFCRTWHQFLADLLTVL